MSDSILDYLPFTISLLIGLAAVRVIFSSDNEPAWPLHFILGLPLGLGISAVLAFTSFLAFNRFNPGFVIIENIAALFGLLLFYVFAQKGSLKKFFVIPNIRRDDWIAPVLLAVFFIPAVYNAFFYV